MRVLLVYSNQSRDLAPAPPIGLSYVASATEDAGHQVLFLDLLLERQPHRALATAMRRFNPEVVGFSVRNIDNVVCQKSESHLGELAEQIKTVRENGPAKIVLGGPAISILGAKAVAQLGADYGIIGEGEEVFPALLAAIEKNERCDALPGVCLPTGNKLVTPAAVRLAKFGASGMERWIDWGAYERKGGTWTIQTKRGCPLQCTYCTYPSLEGRATRRRPVGEIVDEIARIQHCARPRTFEFVDSTFNVPLSHAIALCEEILRRNLKVNLTTMGINPLTASRELFALMHRAGFRSMMVSPESADDSMLASLRKGFTADHVLRTAEAARDCGIASMWFFMFGAPGETRDTVETTASFVEKHLTWKSCLTIFMSGVRVFPGTRLAPDLVAQGVIAASADLSDPFFYISPKVSEEYILQRVNRVIANNPAVVHAAEEGGSVTQRLMDRALYWLRVAPPYWRFLPALLRLPPVRRLRVERPFVGAPAVLEA